MYGGPLSSYILTTLLSSYSFSNDNLQSHRNTSHNSDVTRRTYSSCADVSEILCAENWKSALRDLLKWETKSVQNWHLHNWSTSKNRFLLVFVVHVVSMTMRSAISWESVSSSCKESDAVSYLVCLGVGTSMSVQTWCTYMNNVLSKQGTVFLLISFR